MDKTHCTECTSSERRINIFWNSGITTEGRLKSKTNPCDGVENGCYPEKEDLDIKETPRGLVGSSALLISAKGVGLTPHKEHECKEQRGQRSHSSLSSKVLAVSKKKKKCCHLSRASPFK